MISVTAKVTPQKLAAFVPYADQRLRAFVDDGRQAGELYMSSIVPHGRTNRLAASVVSSIYSVTDSHHIGSVGINQAIAPHAEHVDKGTGVDGPLRSPVQVTRPNRGRRGQRAFSIYGTRLDDTKHPGVMTFQKEGEPRRFRNVVKFRHSSKIMRGKNFSGRTQNMMVDWTRLNVSVLSHELALFFANNRK